MIASHLVAAERALGDDDAELAYEHAKVARRFAARIGVVREAVGLAAYRAGHYAEALSDLRAARRMTGSDEFLPIMADCERGLGRPERALDLVRSPEAERLDRAGRIELAIVESGARRDLGQHDAAVITLQRVPELRNQEPHPWSARLAFAYADALAEAGHESAATDWFERAMMFDEDGETDAAERYAVLTGAVIEDIEEDEEDGEFDVDGDALVEDGEDADPAEPGAERDDETATESDDPDDSGGESGEQAGAGVQVGSEVSAAEDPDAGEEAPAAVASADSSADSSAEKPAPSPESTVVTSVAAPSATSSVASPSEVTDKPGKSDESAGTETAETPAKASGTATEASRTGAEDVQAAEAQVPDGPAPETPRMEIGMGPAFIEPDFGVSARPVPGDVLEDDDDDDADVQPRRPDRRDA
ncbi:hypothetical protein ABZT47_21460 [Sphaerisporangium sp. NPDC005289]|uniref:hypothetical protein n=1 Tax=Sphaerisporangium sp. NPDC005289 TaxID=3155247 RepID=UPI0033B7C830